jgi:hypothetical protein
VGRSRNVRRRGAGERSCVGAARSFDPRRVGALECDTWVCYYRREWWRFLRAAVLVVRHAFALPWPATLRGAWLVLRANQKWAPFPDNDPDAARRLMGLFYALVASHHGETFDVTEAARLEVAWWRVHRERQHDNHDPAPYDDAGAVADPALTEAVARLYAHVYDMPVDAVRTAAAERAVAMDLSDAWVAAGCEPDSPLVPRERAALVRSYAALLAAVHR